MSRPNPSLIVGVVVSQAITLSSVLAAIVWAADRGILADGSVGDVALFAGVAHFIIFVSGLVLGERMGKRTS